MSQVVENRAVVTLTVVGETSEGPAPGWRTMRVRVDAAADVEGYPNLLASDLPREFEALAPPEVALDAASAEPARVCASLAGPGRLRIEGEAVDAE